MMRDAGYGKREREKGLSFSSASIHVRPFNNPLMVTKINQELPHPLDAYYLTKRRPKRDSSIHPNHQLSP